MSGDGGVCDTGGEPGGRTTVGTAGNGGAAEEIAGGEGGGRKAGESVDVAPGGRASTGRGGISASPPDAGSLRKGLSGLGRAGSTVEASTLPSGGGRLGRLIRTVSFVSAFCAGVPVGGGSGVMRTVSFFGSFRLDIDKSYYFWSKLPELNCFYSPNYLFMPTRALLSKQIVIARSEDRAMNEFPYRRRFGQDNARVHFGRVGLAARDKWLVHEQC
jgi:hypothetical protein